MDHSVQESADTHPAILLVDDEESIRQILRAQLTARGYIIQEAATGNEALQTVSVGRPDVILLDLGLPDIDGIEVTRRLRRVTQTPIIIFSVRATEIDKIAALDAGADDYLTKPSPIEALLERIRTALRRPTTQGSRVFEAGDLVVDLTNGVVQIANNRVSLTTNEYDLLKVFVLNAGKLLTQQWLAREVWGEKSDEEARQLLRTTISTLRQKLETDPARHRCIATEPGVGYRLRTEP